MRFVKNSPMPTCGDRFEAGTAGGAGDVGTKIDARGRVLALATYLQALHKEARPRAPSVRMARRLA